MKGEAASLGPSLTPPQIHQAAPSHRRIYSRTFLHAFACEGMRYTRQSARTLRMAL